MEISFTLEHTNLLIVLTGLVIIFYLLSRKFSKRRAIIFGNFETLKKVAGKNFLSYSIIPLILRILALMLIIFAISEPKIITTSASSDTDYVFAIDTSSSMLTPDIPPNRLEATRSAVLDILKENEAGSFGIVTFSGEAKIRTILTKDRKNLTETIKQIQIDETAGTAIGDAVMISSIILSESKNNKTIILITDGRNNRGLSVNETYPSLKEKGIKVYSIGIGKTINETLLTPKELEGLNATAAEFPSLKLEELIDIANATNGKYFEVSQISDLKEAIKQSITPEKHVFDLQFYLLLGACLILLLGWALEMTKYRVIP